MANVGAMIHATQHFMPIRSLPTKRDAQICNNKQKVPCKGKQLRRLKSMQPKAMCECIGMLHLRLGCSTQLMHCHKKKIISVKQTTFAAAILASFKWCLNTCALTHTRTLTIFILTLCWQLSTSKLPQRIN